MDDRSNASAPRTRICIASPDFLGQGAGSGLRELAEALAAAGHRVTALDLTTRVEPIDDARRAEYAAKGIALEALGPAPVAIGGVPDVAAAYDTYLWLKRREFDIVHAPEWRGRLAFALQAKRQGLAFGSTTFVLGIFGPSLRGRLLRGEPLDDPDDLKRDVMERQCAATADRAWSPDPAILDWARDQGWRLPDSASAPPGIIAASSDPSEGGPAAPPAPVRELVLEADRIDPRGLALFCDAMDLLVTSQPGLAGSLALTIAGEPAPVAGMDGRSYLQRRSRRWPGATSWAPIPPEPAPGLLSAWPVIDGEGRRGALDALDAGLPFLSTDVGGIADRLDNEARGHRLVPADPAAWADAIARAAREGIPPLSPAASPANTPQSWLAWHSAISANEPPESTATPASTPKVSVCLVHRHREVPGPFIEAVARLRAERGASPFEVVLVNATGLPSDAVPAFVAASEDLAALGARILDADRPRDRGGAWNLAASQAGGDALLFLDESYLLKPGAVATLASASGRTGADLASCFSDELWNTFPPGINHAPLRRHPFLSEGIAAVLAGAAPRDTAILARREAFSRLGGFREGGDVGGEDREFWTRAAAAGFHLEVVPEALLWRWRTPQDAPAVVGERAERAQSALPVLEVVPPALRPALLLAQGLQEKVADAEALARGNAARKAHAEAALWTALGRAQAAESRIGEAEARAHAAEAHAASAEARLHAILTAPAPEPPLRYRFADWVNHRIKTVPGAHGVARTLVANGRRAWKRVGR